VTSVHGDGLFLLLLIMMLPLIGCGRRTKVELQTQTCGKILLVGNNRQLRRENRAPTAKRVRASVRNDILESSQSTDYVTVDSRTTEAYHHSLAAATTGRVVKLSTVFKYTTMEY
jgi:hypothetical protein